MTGGYKLKTFITDKDGVPLTAAAMAMMTIFHRADANDAAPLSEGFVKLLAAHLLALIDAALERPEILG